MTTTAFEPVIGLEVHVQLATSSKMFCRCPAEFGAPPNTHVCPVCTGQPGTLPRLNGRAIELAVRAGLILNCTIDEVLKFDRKNYFYPDLPKGYQISQYDRPLCSDGSFTFHTEDGADHQVTIQRAHLEEDSGKIIHPPDLGMSLVDLNRAGTPLLEIVSGPDLRSPAQASAYLQDMRQALRYAEVSECDMEKGSFRCDANVSLRPKGSSEMGTRTETKNLNSFRFVEQALTSEIERQTAILEGGSKVVQATMGFNSDTGKTHVQRTKETEADYRYFPEPDLPRFDVTASQVQNIRQSLPTSPADRRERYLQNGVALKHAQTLLADKHLSDYFEGVLASGAPPPAAAKWVLTEVLRLANDKSVQVEELTLTPKRTGEVIEMVESGEISLGASRVLATALDQDPDASPRATAEKLDIFQASEAEDIEAFVCDVLESETDVVKRYRDGQEGLLDALIGSVMKCSKGKANPHTVRSLLIAKLKD